MKELPPFVRSKIAALERVAEDARALVQVRLASIKNLEIDLGNAKRRGAEAEVAVIEERIDEARADIDIRSARQRDASQTLAKLRSFFAGLHPTKVLVEV